jgi:hypothetical protein
MHQKQTLQHQQNSLVIGSIANYGDSIKFEFAKHGLDVDRLVFSVSIENK